MSTPLPGSQAVSLAEFLRMPEESAYRIELIGGAVVREPRPATLHGRIVALLTYVLQAHVQAHEAGIVLTDSGFVLETDPATVLGPDVAYVARERLPPSPYTETFLHGAPDLAIEVASPSNTASALQDKVLRYLAAGARLVWIVDPRTRSVTSYQADGSARLYSGENVLDGGDVLPLLRIPLAEIFPV
jgi:Uma2 family endonuclease